MKMKLLSSTSTFLLLVIVLVLTIWIGLVASIGDQDEDIICIGNYFFKVYYDGTIDSLFPPSDVVCDIINGTLLLDRYSSLYEGSIPKSIKSIKKIDGTLNLLYLDEYPLFLDSIKEVETLQLYGNTYDNVDPWSLNHINNIHSTISSMHMPKLMECGSVAISHSTISQSFTSLSNVQKVKGDIEIYDSLLASFEISSLKLITGRLIIEYMPAPMALIFPNGIEIGGDLTIMNSNNNISLKTLKGSVNIFGSLQVEENYGLVDLSGLGEVKVGNSIILVENLARIKMFNTSEITNLKGNLRVYLSEIKNYPLFSSLHSIGGDLFVPFTIKQKDSLETYYPKLRSVKGTLHIIFCNELIDLGIIKFLDFIGSLHVNANHNLISLEGLEHITKFGSVVVQHNKNLKSLKGLDNVDYMDGDLYIGFNDELTSLDGLNNLQYVRSLDIEYNKQVTSLNGLNNLAVINGALAIYSNKNLLTTKGINKLRYVKSIYVDARDQQNMNELSIGREGSNLGYPLIRVDNLGSAANLTFDKVKKSLFSRCKTINLHRQSTFICNQRDQ